MTLRLVHTKTLDKTCWYTLQNYLFFVLILTKMLTVANWKPVSPSPIPVLFAVTQDKKCTCELLGRNNFEQGRGGGRLCSVERLLHGKKLKILRNVSTGLSGVAATEGQALKLTFFAFVRHFVHIWQTFCLENPGSITNTTPSIVRDVSAMLVDTTHLRPMAPLGLLGGAGSKMRCCWAGGRVE